MFDATAKQKILITRLCMALGIREPLEEKSMSKGEAGGMIRELLGELKAQGTLTKLGRR